MGSKPKTPDYKGAAEAQAASDKESLMSQTWANRPTQYTPWGSTSWEAGQAVDPATGDPVTTWTQYEQLTPELQQALNAQIGLQTGKSELAGGMMGRMAGEFADPMDWSKFGPMQGLDPTAFGNLGTRALQEGYETGDYASGYGFMGPKDEYSQRGLRTDLSDPEETRMRMEESIYGRQASRLDPQWEQQGQALEIKLRNQGLRPGDQAWEAEMQRFDQAKTDAYDVAQQQAVMGGQQAAEGMFGMERGRMQDINQYMQQMNMNEAQRAQFFNQAQAARSANEAAQAQFANQAQQQRNLEAAQQAQFYNQAQQGMFGQQLAAQPLNQQAALQQAEYANKLRQQGIQEEMTKRGLTLNEMNAILSGQQVQNPQFQDFSQAGRAAPTQYMNAAQQQGNFDQAAYQSQMGGIGSMLGLGGSILGGMATGKTGFFG